MGLVLYLQEIERELQIYLKRIEQLAGSAQWVPMVSIVSLVSWTSSSLPDPGKSSISFMLLFLAFIMQVLALSTGEVEV